MAPPRARHLLALSGARRVVRLLAMRASGAVPAVASVALDARQRRWAVRELRAATSTRPPRSHPPRPRRPLQVRAVTPAELRAECARVRAQGRDHTVLVLPPRRTEPRGWRVRVMPGVTGEIMCCNSERGIVVRVAVDAIDRALDRAGVPR